MDKKALKALKESITSWKTKKIKGFIDMGSGGCPLCRALNYTCKSCPVMRRTGLNNCKDTPWKELYDYLTENSPKIYDRKIIEKYQQEEIAFLESLLPEEKK